LLSFSLQFFFFSHLFDLVFKFIIQIENKLAL
jgi:hypothetical protein